jgi:hypothetical protein
MFARSVRLAPETLRKSAKFTISVILISNDLKSSDIHVFYGLFSESFYHRYVLYIGVPLSRKRGDMGQWNIRSLDDKQYWRNVLLC